MGWAQVVDVERKISENLSQKSEEIKKYLAKSIDENVRLSPSLLIADNIIKGNSEYSVKFKRSGVITLFVNASGGNSNNIRTASVEYSQYSKNGESSKILSVTLDYGIGGNYEHVDIEVSRGDILKVKPKTASVNVDLEFSLRAKVKLENGIAEVIYE
jgi:hypothetical protein